MPEYYTDTRTGAEMLVVSYDELVPTYYRSVRTLSTIVLRDMKRGFGMRRVSRGHNGGRALIEFDSLPLWVQDGLDDPRRDIQAVEKYYKHLVEAERFYAQHLLPDGRHISNEIQRKYTANASTIEAVLALKAERERLFARCGKRVPKLWEGLRNDTVAFKEIQKKRFNCEHTLPESTRRFQETVSNYANAISTGSMGDGKSTGSMVDGKKAALMTLISEQHISNSIAGARKVHQREQDLFESIFRGIGYKPNYTDVYAEYTDFKAGRKEIIVNETGEVLNPADFATVSEATIRGYLAKWESKAATLRLRTGDRQKLMSETKPYHSFERSEFAGSLLSIDDRVPAFEYPIGATGKGRVWFYLGYDYGADCYTTIVWGKDKEGIILDFYRQMVRNYAQWGVPLPAELEAESNLNSSFKDSFLKEGNMFQFVHISGNAARTKIIERENRDMRYCVERKKPGWVARPFARNESNRAGNDKVPMLPFEEIVEMVLDHYDSWNNEPHFAHPEMSRWEFFMSHQHPKLQPINWFGIIPFLGKETKSSCHTGIVRLNNGECLLGVDGMVALGDQLINLMKMVEGQELTIRWLDGNDGKILKAYAYIGGQYACELVQKPTYKRARIERTEADEAACELMSSYVATVEGFGNTRKKEIEKVTVLDTDPRVELKYNTIPNNSMRRKLITNSTGEVEVLPDNDEYNSDLSGVERTFKSALAERF